MCQDVESYLSTELNRALLTILFLYFKECPGETVMSVCNGCAGEQQRYRYGYGWASPVAD
jgi:hypothetical protein